MTTINKTAVQATLHCLAGCAVGEVLGMVIGTALGWHGAATVVLSISLAFAFGYSFSMVSLLRHGLGLRHALKVALAADTLSIATMEIADNAFMILVPGAIGAGLNSVHFWVSLALSLVVAFFAALPVNRWLIARGKGHAIAHQYHVDSVRSHQHGDNEAHDHHNHTAHHA